MAREHSAVSLYIKYALFFINFIVWLLSMAVTGLGAYILVLKKKKVHDAIDFFFDPSPLMCMLLSMAVTGLGAYILVLKKKKVHDAIDFFFDPSTLMCTAGSVALFVSFLGWLGALREYTSCLRLYKWAVTIAFFGELIVTVFIFVFYFAPQYLQKIGIFPETALKDAIRKYGVVDDQDMQQLIDNMQESLDCCGFSDSDTGFLDWNENQYFNCTSAPKNTTSRNNPEGCSVPPSCCKLKPGDMKNILCGRGVMQVSPSGTVMESAEASGRIYMRGCLKAVGEYINEHALTIGGVLLGILLPQMYMMYLARTLREQVLIQRSKWDRPQPAAPKPATDSRPPPHSQQHQGRPPPPDFQVRPPHPKHRY